MPQNYWVEDCMTDKVSYNFIKDLWRRINKARTKEYMRAWLLWSIAKKKLVYRHSGKLVEF